MKKLIALTLLGTMVFSMPVMAKDYEPPVAVYLEASSNIGDPDVTVAAIEEDKLVGEYMNNAVTRMLFLLHRAATLLLTAYRPILLSMF